MKSICNILRPYGAHSDKKTDVRTLPVGSHPARGFAPTAIIHGPYGANGDPKTNDL